MKNHFIYFNPNPTVKYKTDGTPKKWTKCDCTVRALCKASGFTWEYIFRDLCERAMATYDMPNSDDVVEWYLNKLGYKRVKMQRGGKKPTINEFCEQNKNGTFIIRISGHIVTVQDGSIFDCWDCGAWKVRSYYEKITKFV